MPMGDMCLAAREKGRKSMTSLTNLRAHFIKATEEFNTFEKSVPAPYLRKSFISDADAVAKVTVAACGFYELYVNGERLTKGHFAPYISNTDDYIYADEYEIKIKEGENVIGFMLGNGLQNNPGGYIWDFDKAEFRSAPSVSASIEWKGASGEDNILFTDESFKTKDSPVRSDDYRFGEVYDASFEIEGWSASGFDASEWDNAVRAVPPRGEIRICTAENIACEREIKPVSVTKASDGGYIYDFGEINAGLCTLRITGSKGQCVTLQHAEVVKNGTINLENVWFVRKMWERDKEIVHKDTYILKGGEEEAYTPFFTFHGFRYVRVEGITDEQATESLLTYRVMHSDIKKRGGFSSSDSVVNKIQENAERSGISNFWYFPLDCPQREKNGWTADAALSSEYMLLCYSPEVSYKEWLRNIVKAQNKDGALPGIIPTGGWGFNWGNGPAWDSVLTYLPYYIYVYRGDKEVIFDTAHAVMSYLDYLSKRADEDFLMHIGLGDWCHVGGRAPKAPLEVTDTVISMDIAKKAAFLFGEAGLSLQRDFAEALAEKFRAAFRAKLIDFDTMTVSGACQTSQAMALYYGLFEPSEEAAAFARLSEMIEEADEHFDVGVLGGKILFDVLSRFGESDRALHMIARKDFPSYGYLIEKGATTLWENFMPELVNGNSGNHHFWGSVSAWFIKYLAGIKFNPEGSNINYVEISPSFVKSLDSAEGFYEAPSGKLSVSWKRENGFIVLKLSVPESMSGKIKLEKGFKFDDGSLTKAARTGEYKITEEK